MSSCLEGVWVQFTNSNNLIPDKRDLPFSSFYPRDHYVVNSATVQVVDSKRRGVRLQDSRHYTKDGCCSFKYLWRLVMVAPM